VTGAEIPDCCIRGAPRDTTLDLEWVELPGETPAQSCPFTRSGDHAAAGLAGCFYGSGERALVPPHEARVPEQPSDLRVALSLEYVRRECHDLSSRRH
jgi:hypothetical protein